MPFFTWKGIDLAGCIHTGTMRARSSEHVQELLYAQELGLISCKRTLVRSYFYPISLGMKSATFKHLATLLQAGILLDHALTLVANHTQHKQLRHVLEDILNDVHHGIPLSSACAVYPELFDHVTISLVQAGQESGFLGQALLLIANYWGERDQLQKKIRAATLLPAITCTIFLLIVGVIVIVIVPMFAHMFDALGHTMPKSTYYLFAMSNFLMSKYFLIASCFGLFIMYAIKKCVQNVRVRSIIDHCIEKIPFIGSLRTDIQCSYFLYALGMLVQGRVSIVQALGCARTVLTSNNLQEEAFALERYIDAGHTFNQASTKLTQFLMPDVWAMLDVGQESGRLGDLSLSAAERYKELVARRLLLITTVIQPVLMLLLGFGIIGIILSVYMPIFNLSSVIA